MTSLENSDHHVEHSARVDFSQKTEKELGELYTLQQNVERGQVMTNTRHDLQSLAVEISKNAQVKTTFYTEMSKRMVDNKETAHEKERLLALLDPKKNPNLSPEYIDSVLIRIFQDVFFLSSFGQKDLDHLREYLPIIDEIRDGKCFAYGKKGKAHAVLFDDFTIDSYKDGYGKEQYVFDYKVYVDVKSSLSPGFKNLVTNTYLPLGSAQTLGHRFDVVVQGDPDYDPQKVHDHVPQIEEVRPSDERLNGKLGCVITQGDGSRLILIAHQKDINQEAAVIKHEISHLCGMVSEAPDLSQAQEAQKALLAATTENGVDDTKAERKEYWHAQDLTETQVLENFDMNEQKRGIQETLREKKIVMNNATINIIVNGIKKYVGERLPVIAQEKDVGVASFVMKTDAAKACKEQIKTEIKEKFNPLFDVVSVFDQYPQIKASYQTNAQEFNFDTCCGLSQTLSDLVSSDQSVYMFLNNADYRTSIENIKKEMQKNLDGKKDAITQFEAHTPSTVNDVEGKTFDTFDQKLQDYLTAIASPELLAVIQPQQINGTTGAQEKVKSDLIANIKNKITDTSIPQDKKDYIAEKYFEYLVKTRKIIIPPSVPSDADAYRTKYENGVLTVEYGKKEDWEKEGKAPETPGTKPEGILGPFQGLFGEAKQAFEKAIQDKKSVFAAIGAAMSVFFTGLLKFLGDKFGLKLTPDESTEQDAASSKAAFEKVSDGLASPSIDWFKQQSVVVKGDKTWDDAWKDFMGDTKVQAYLTEAKKAENAAKYSYSDASHAGILLEEATAFKASGDTDAAVFYKDKHKEGEKSASEKIKDGVKQTWDDMKKEYSDVELDDSVITALDIKEPLETSGQPDKGKYRAAIEKAFDACLGKREMIQKWCVFLKKHHAPLNIEWWKSCETNKSYMSLPATFTVQHVNFDTIESSYMKKKTGGFNFDQFTADFNALNWEQKGKLLQTNEWPDPATK